MSKAFIPLDYPAEAPHPQEIQERARNFYRQMDQRRSVRTFSDRPIPEGVLEDLIATASSAPSGAHKQPWTFCVVSAADLKKAIREAAEKEEFENYHGRMSEEWLKDLEPFETDWHKEFLEVAPALIVVFKQSYGMQDGRQTKHYYVNESVGIASGFLLAAIHQAGLVSLTHTPSPMNFLADLLQRPKNEKAFLLIPVGYPAEGSVVPDIRRKPLADVMVKYP